MENKESVLTLENRRKISFTGAESVDSFSETCILLTVTGKKVRIDGSHLKILSFSQGSGTFLAVGEVDNIRFGGGKRGFLRLFK